MEDLFDKARDRWQKSFRHPLYLRLSFLFGLALIAAAIVGPRYVPRINLEDPTRRWVLYGVVALVALWTFWASFQAWKCKILISPTSIKAHCIWHGRMRISWEHMDRVVYKWRPLGHLLVLVGSDGGKVGIRSAMKGYDEIIDLIRAKAPEHIVRQIDDYIGVDDDEDDEAQPDPS